MPENNKDNFIDFLQNRLQSELPGKNSHISMAPVWEDKIMRSFTPSKNSVPCGVLIILFSGENSNKLKVILTLRSKHINHSGQISFPGGRQEADETIVETAIREAQEEIGLEPSDIEIIGTLSELYVPPSNSLITPVVCFAMRSIHPTATSDEVDEVFSVSLDSLLSPEKFKKEMWNFHGLEMEVPFWDVHHSTPLWGATAMMLKELLVLYEEHLNN
jgi:8-oxo-dGTP pyrophosphatase MutT (NUDIX family)